MHANVAGRRARPFRRPRCPGRGCTHDAVQRQLASALQAACTSSAVRAGDTSRRCRWCCTATGGLRARARAVSGDHGPWWGRSGPGRRRRDLRRRPPVSASGSWPSPVPGVTRPSSSDRALVGAGDAALGRGPGAGPCRRVTAQIRRVGRARSVRTFRHPRPPDPLPASARGTARDQPTTSRQAVDGGRVHVVALLGGRARAGRAPITTSLRGARPRGARCGRWGRPRHSCGPAVREVCRDLA